MLWDFVRRRVKASRVKDQTESKIISSFDNDVIKYSMWFSDKRAQIIKENDIGTMSISVGYSGYILYVAMTNSSTLSKTKNENELKTTWI